MSVESSQPLPLPFNLSDLKLVLEERHDTKGACFGEHESEWNDSDDSDDEFGFTEEYDFTVNKPNQPPNSAPLITLKVRTIDRHKIPRGEFHSYMDNICEDFLQFSVAVFNPNGQIKRDIRVPGSPKSGSGVWGAEINHGKLAYIEDLRVHEQFQRRGLGRWVIDALLKTSVLADCPFFFAWATALDTSSFFAPPDPDFAAKVKGVIAFWRAVGFRRVGGTFFFGYARDAQHASRSLRVEEDGEQTQVSGTTSDAVIFGEYSAW